MPWTSSWSAERKEKKEKNNNNNNNKNNNKKRSKNNKSPKLCLGDLIKGHNSTKISHIPKNQA